MMWRAMIAGRPVRTQPQRGTTLIEALLVVGIIGFLAMIGAPIYQSFQNSNELDVATNILAQDLYQAQGYSRSVARDSNWGVAVNGQVITLFAGTSYAARNAALDTSYTVPGAVRLGGSTQIVYDKLTGLPQPTGTFNLGTSIESRTVTVNAKGMVEY